MRTWLILFLFPVLCSCATWAGRTKGDLVQRYGIPESQMETPEGTLYQYEECEGGMFIGESICRKHLFLVKDDVVIRDTVLER